MQSVEKTLAKTGLSRSEALRLVLMHCVGREQLPQKIYGGLSTKSGEIYLVISRVRKLLGRMEVNLPMQYANYTIEEIFAGYSRIFCRGSDELSRGSQMGHSRCPGKEACKMIMKNPKPNAMLQKGTSEQKLDLITYIADQIEDS